MKKLLALISCIVICSICVIPVNANAYPILSDWAKEEAYLAEANDLFPGGEMHDDLRCAASRGQAAWYAVLLAETLLGHEIENAASGVFSDMSNSFFKNIVDKAYTAGIVNGQKDGEFHEKDMVTREQYAAMLYRTIKYVEQERNTSVLTQVQGTIQFEDDEKISNWAKESVHALASLGVIQGTSQSNFEPQREVSFEQISYTSVHVNNQTLSVELQSSGEGRCTLDDVKAIQNIYTVIHAQSLADKIRNVKIEIVDRTGTVIYDETEADVSSKVENDLAQTTTADTEIIADRDILQEARNVLADTSYSIQSVNISDAEEITGKCLNLTLTLSNADDSSVSRISSVYDNLESYSLSTGAITQCNITLLNDEQECIAYMIGDFQYGNCIAWISPDYENAFVAQEGPQPDN